MKIITGDLIELAMDGEFDLIVQGCNCFCTMGKGIAKQIKEKCPEAYEADQKTKTGDATKLGTISWAGIERDECFLLVNAYTQFDFRSGYNSDTKRRVEYGAVRSCFIKIRELIANEPDLRIGYPMIGAGLAGGEWEIISKIIDEELDGYDHTLVMWDGGSL